MDALTIDVIASTWFALAGLLYIIRYSRGKSDFKTTVVGMLFLILLAVL